MTDERALPVGPASAVVLVRSIALLALLALGAVRLTQAGSALAVNLAFLRAVCVPDACPPDAAPFVGLPPAAVTLPTPVTPCQHLWASRMLAPRQAALAQAELAGAAACPRAEQVAAWQAWLAYAAGETAAAQQALAALPAGALLAWSGQRIAAGDVGFGRFLADTAGAAVDLTPAERALSAIARGDAQRQEQQWSAAAAYYEEALGYDAANLQVVIRLSTVYRNLGAYEQALTLLTGYVDDLPVDRPWVGATIYSEMALCYTALGDAQRAADARAQSDVWRSRYAP